MTRVHKSTKKELRQEKNWIASQSFLLISGNHFERDAQALEEPRRSFHSCDHVGMAMIRGQRGEEGAGGQRSRS